MLLIDTSVWIPALRDKTGQIRTQLQAAIDTEIIALTRFTQLELLQGSRDQQEWNLLSQYLHDQNYVEAQTRTWESAAKIYYDLRRQGLTVRSPIDCCIAQIAIENQVLLMHNDRDFDTISQIRSLQHLRFQPT